MRARSAIIPLGCKRAALTLMTHLAPILIVLALAAPALASSGDRHSSYRLCHNLCLVSRCEAHQPPIAWWLRLFFWSCDADCVYDCSHRMTNEAEAGRESFHQFHGKWAFYRLGPIQEPLSVLFSLGNLWVHYRGLQAVKARVREENQMRKWLEASAYVQMNTWLWSAVFHTRDVKLTERLDYFSALTTVAIMMLYALIRIFGLQTPTTHSPALLPVCGALALFLVGHFIFVSTRNHFPYGYHVKVAMVMGMFGNILWVLWSLSFRITMPTVVFEGTPWPWPQPYPPHNAHTQRIPRQAFRPALLVVLTIAAMSFELLDFPPLFRTLDAHAIWHAATIPLAEAWYRFLITDANELEGSLLSGPHAATYTEKAPTEVKNA